MNHRLSRLKTAIKPQAPGLNSNSTAGSPQAACGGQSLPPYYQSHDGSGNASSSGSGSASAQGQPPPLSMAEKTLPPGAAGYNHRQTQWDQAQKERDELERAIRLSEEESQYEAALRESQEAEEQARLRQSAELDAEQAALQASRREQEELEDQLAIAQAEEEQAVLRAIRESEREAGRRGLHQQRAGATTGTKGKGKQRDGEGEAHHSINNHDADVGNRPSSSSSGRAVEGGGATTDGNNTRQSSTTDEDDEDLRRAMELSIREQEREKHEQEELLRRASTMRRQQGQGGDGGSNDDSSMPTSPSTCTNQGHNNISASMASPLSPSRFTVTNPSSSSSSSSSSAHSFPISGTNSRGPASPTSAVTNAALLSRPVPPLPARNPPRRSLSIDDEVSSQSVSDAPPAYEPRSSDQSTKENQNQEGGGSVAVAVAATCHSPNAPPAMTRRSSSSLTQAASEMSMLPSSSQAQADARALEEKRLIFYPPVADNEMAEGSMRAFVPHMLFAARARERSDPDEYLPITSRDVDLRQLSQGSRRDSNGPANHHPQGPTSPTSPTEPSPARPRRPLPPLPVELQNAQTQPSALSMLDQKVGAASDGASSTSSPSYISHQPSILSPSSGHETAISTSPSAYDTAQSTFSFAPNTIQSQSGPSISSTTGAVENEDYDDPFDDSRAASLTDEEDHSYGSGSDTADEDYYNEHPSHTINATGEDYNRGSTSGESTSGQQSPVEPADQSKAEDTTESSHASGSENQENGRPSEGDTTAAMAHVGRYDYARTPQSGFESSAGQLPQAAPAEPQDSQTRVNDEQNGLAAGEGYMSGDSAVSWESTGSETEYQTAGTSSTIHESAQDINTNISFGFNPLSSPTKSLDWQGRFPDLIVLSRFADDNSATGTASAAENTKEDYRTFAFEAPTWRELLAYLMWHGNSMFEAAARDKHSSQLGSLRVSLILEFVKTAAPPSTLVRLQVHLLSTNAADAAGSVPASRGVALSRQPLSSRPTNYVSSSLPWQQGSKGESTHLVLAFPKPYHSLPFNLGTIGTHLHNAHKAAVVQQTQQSQSDQYHRIQLGDKNRIHNTQFLTDLIKGIDMCTDHTAKARHGKTNGNDDAGHRGGAGNSSGHVTPDDSRFDKLVSRLREKRQSMRGTLREMHKNTLRKRRHRKMAKDNKGKGRADDRGSDSDQSYLESQPQAEDYHITPFPAVP